MMSTTIRKVTKMWTTREGAKIRICDMTDDHLRNAIKMCERMHAQAQREMPYPNFNGEMAQYYAEGEWASFQESDPDESFPLYIDLCDEAARRGLVIR